MQRISITYKLTALLALLSTAPAIHLTSGLTGADLSHRARSRFVACEQLALGCSLQLKHQDYLAIEHLMDQYSQRMEDVQGLRLVRFDGLVIHQIGRMHEQALESQEKTSKQISVPIIRNQRNWGALEVAFDSELSSLQLWQIGQVVITTVALNLLTFGLLLRRSLSVLDSGNAVPRRVRNTLDTIAGGVVILDSNRKIVMANEAFQRSCLRSLDDLLGQKLDQIQFRSSDAQMPWERATVQKQRISGATLFLADSATGAERCFVVNATPIFDSKDAVAGTMVSFEDVTTLEQQKQSLLLALSELEVSKDQIHQQNLRLQELASRDVLTGAFNRRSLFEQLETHWNEYQTSGQLLSCIMFDVDHFKKLNDNHGHAVGDQVLRDVSRTIQEAVPAPGFAGRYGGEEFCVVLPTFTAKQATEVGELIRQAVETKLKEPYAVTASLGVSSCEFGAASFQLVIEQADQALYAAKHGGRNAVRCWSSSLVEESAAEQRIMISTSCDQPISYHAVASLHAALAYRDADTALHSQRVAEMAVSLGRGLMSVSQLYILEIAAILHDIGKVGVPDSILLKPAKLTPEEWKVMEAHARMGVEIVESSFNSKPLADIVRYHHYRYDGTNTPAGEPVGEDIPIGARIVCIVDAFDAMISNRVYRKGRPTEEAFAELRRCAGTQFDPELVERFIAAQVGWRADSRFMHADMEDKMAIAIGHLTERTMHAFEAQDTKVLSESLEKMAKAGEQYELPAIKHLATELGKAIGESHNNDWECAVPILQNLLDMCLMVQRAHIRGVASRPQEIPHCPQSSYFSSARAWWEADQV